MHNDRSNNKYYYNAYQYLQIISYKFLREILKNIARLEYKAMLEIAFS